MSERSPEGGSAPARRVTRAVLAALWLTVVAALTLTPQATTFSPDLGQLSTCLICGDRGTADALLNLFLLAPLGLILNDIGWRPLRVAGAALLFSACIELTQHFIPGRYSSLGDVTWNTAGAWASALAWSLRTRWLPGTDRDAGRLRVLAVAVASVVTIGFGWLMKPDLPTGRYWGQWTPDLGSMEQYDGTVLRAKLDSTPIPSWPFPRSADPRRLLMGDWRIDVTFVAGHPPRSLAPILNIYAERTEVVLLGAVGRSLVFRQRSRARALRFAQPDVRLRHAFAGVSVGDTVHASVVRNGSRRCLIFEGDRTCPVFTPGRAWSLIAFPNDLGPLPLRSLDALWMLVLLLPVGFWSPRRRDLVEAGAVVTVAIGLAVALTPLGMPLWAEVAGALMGLLAGRWLRSVLGTLLARLD